MKRYLIVLLTIVTLSSFLFPGILPRENTPVGENNFFGVSIEHYREKQGWTPVILFSQHLELFCLVNASGQVFEGLNPSDLQPLFTIDLKTSGIHVGERYFSCRIQVQNPVRTRMSLSNKNQSFTLQLKDQQNRVEVNIGGTSLPLHYTRAEFREIAYGLYELTLNGPWVCTYCQLIYERATGRIYSHYDRKTRLEFERSGKRLKKIDRGENP